MHRTKFRLHSKVLLMQNCLLLQADAVQVDMLRVFFLWCVSLSNQLDFGKNCGFFFFIFFHSLIPSWDRHSHTHTNTLYRLWALSIRYFSQNTQLTYAVTGIAQLKSKRKLYTYWNLFHVRLIWSFAQHQSMLYLIQIHVRSLYYKTAWTERKWIYDSVKCHEKTFQRLTITATATATETAAMENQQFRIY